MINPACMQKKQVSFSIKLDCLSVLRTASSWEAKKNKFWVSYRRHHLRFIFLVVLIQISRYMCLPLSSKWLRIHMSSALPSTSYPSKAFQFFSEQFNHRPFICGIIKLAIIISYRRMEGNCDNYTWHLKLLLKFTKHLIIFSYYIIFGRAKKIVNKYSHLEY